ncbi:hypothetical protein NQZ68_013961 [Dissostichus eleginoides]|nr:hypothetical protein NQZ68_013961 [Dissostichus eleginoides]
MRSVVDVKSGCFAETRLLSAPQPVLQVARVRRAQCTGTGAGAQGESTRPEGVASPTSRRIEKQWRLSSRTQRSFEECARHHPRGLPPLKQAHVNT